MARIIRSVEDRIAEIDKKIAAKNEEIKKLEDQKYKLQHPINMKIVMAKAKEAGLTAEEIAEKLGLDV